MAWLVGGDLNEITCDTEKLGGGPRPLRQMSAFNEALMFCGLHDMGEADKSLTWRGKRRGDDIFERLDRYVGNRQWMNSFPHARFKNLDFYGSDHRPVWCELMEEQAPLVRKGKGRFHFEDKWFMEKTFVPDLLCEWKSLEGRGDLQRKLKLCGTFLGSWAKERCNANSKPLRSCVI